jgi:SAM-dependent methyltransferase
MSEGVMGKDAEVDRANRRAMAGRDAVVHYQRQSALDPGEAALYGLVAAEAAGRPVLDIGVGGGRTTPALTAISRDYTAIDYTPAMVEVMRRRFPAVRVLHGDARRMPMFADGAFFLVVFSCAGLDMVGVEDRARILSEVRRVLQPGGVFVFSTHSWVHRRGLPEQDLASFFAPLKQGGSPLGLARTLARSLRNAALGYPNLRALRHLAERHEDWALLNSHYHDFSTLMHYTTLAAQRAALARAGFVPGAVACTHEGRLVGAEEPDTVLLHLAARVPA